MPRILTRCPFCSRVFGLTAGGYPHMRDAVKRHMHECPERPEHLTAEEVTGEAERIMDEVEHDS